MKRLFAVAAMTACTLSFIPALRAGETPKKDLTGFYVGLNGGFSRGISTLVSEKPTVQLNVEGGYRFNEWLSVQIGIGGGKLDLVPQICCSGLPSIQNDRNSYWRSFSDNEWHYFPELTSEGWWYADLRGKTSYYKAVIQANFDLFSFFTDRVGFDVSPRIGGMCTVTEISGESSATGNNIGLKDKAKIHFTFGGEVFLSFKFKNDMKAGVFIGLDVLSGKHFDNMPVHAHIENFISDTGIRLICPFGK